MLLGTQMKRKDDRHERPEPYFSDILVKDGVALKTPFLLEAQTVRQKLRSHENYP